MILSTRVTAFLLYLDELKRDFVDENTGEEMPRRYVKISRVFVFLGPRPSTVYVGPWPSKFYCYSFKE